MLLSSANPPYCFGGRAARPPPGGLSDFMGSFSEAADPVVTNIYVDGFNLYYGAVKGTRCAEGSSVPGHTRGRIRDDYEA